MLVTLYVMLIEYKKHTIIWGGGGVVKLEYANQSIAKKSEKHIPNKCESFKYVLSRLDII